MQSPNSTGQQMTEHGGHSWLSCLGAGLIVIGAGFLLPNHSSGTPTPDDTTANAPAIPKGLPVNAKAVIAKNPVRRYGLGYPRTIRNRLSIQQIRNSIRQQGKQLLVDLSHIKKTLDGEKLDPTRIYGTVLCGPYPFESKETKLSYLRMRRDRPIRKGSGVIDVGYLRSDRVNSEDWKDRGWVAVRMQLFQEQTGPDLKLGVYDTFCMFEITKGGVKLLPSIVDGPSVNLVRSDDPSQCVIALSTNQRLVAKVNLSNGKTFSSPQKTSEHEIVMTDLKPDTEYTYTVTVGKMTTPPFALRTAPKKGATSFLFAYGGDSREGPGLGLESHMGCNYLELQRLTALAYEKRSRFLLQGGDLVNGYTTQPDDYRTQLYGWKHAIRGFHHQRPVYPAMGNHECLIYNFGSGSGYGVTLDRWPYKTESSEAIFAEQLVLPKNGPKPANPNRPPYTENVYSFQYGCLKCISVNNNYWISYSADKFGGSPEGYILPDQMAWIKNELSAAEKDPTIKYVVVYMQEPVIPNGGHIQDAMWYRGSNKVRAATWDGKKLIAEKQGIIEVRNELMRALHNSSKVVAVLGSDEHGYSKVLINDQVPVGIPSKDDKNKNGKIDYYLPGEKKETASPMASLKNPVWYFVGGGFGAPYYSRESTPWNDYWTNIKKDKGQYFYYSSQSNILLFEVTPQSIGVKVYNPFGEVMDQVDDLLAVRKE